MMSRNLLSAVRLGTTFAGKARELSSGGKGGPTLRYFESRGRAQSLRYALADSNVDFVDEKISLQHVASGNWMNMKHNEKISGPFGSLPVLQWDTFRLGQTEAISAYLYLKLGQGKDGSAEKAAMSSALTSLAHQDLIGICLQLLAGVGSMGAKASDADITPPVQHCFARVNSILPRLESMLHQQTSGYFLGSEPVMGDYFIFEALEVATLMFGSTILEPYSSLRAFRTKMSERPKLKQYLLKGDRPLSMTGNPSEAAVISRLRSLLIN